jgi:hypothetical protein
MNASLARRIRNAEAVLISAIDRHISGQRKSICRSGMPRSGQCRPGLLILIPYQRRLTPSHQTPASLYKANCVA